MRLALLMMWALFGFAGAVDGQEPPPLLLPAPRPATEAAQETAKTEKAAAAPQQTKEAEKTEKAVPPQPKDATKTDKKAPAPPQPKEPGKAEEAEKAETKEPEKAEEAAAPKQGSEPLTPPYPAFMDPRAFSWVQHRLPPPEKPCVELACQLRMCLGDHRCLREKICDYLFHWPCPSQLLFGIFCPRNP